MGKSVLTELSNSRPLPLSVVISLLVVAIGIGLCSAVTSDGCDWTGSGLSGSGRSDSQERGVQPLYLRCRQGRIRWSYPSGALRLLLRLQGTSKEFRACLRPGPQFQGARIYLEGHRRLHLLYTPQQDNEVTGSSRRMRCFASVRGQAALYVEALPQVGPVASLKKNVAEFAYDLQPLDKRSYEDDLQECRPCSDQEILEAFCTSDFVVKGTVTSLYHNEATGLSELTVQASNVIRDNEPAVFAANKPKSKVAKTGVLHRDINCGTKAGIGQFLFLGKRILDVPYVVCAPRIGQWKKIRTKALMANSHQCQLD